MKSVIEYRKFLLTKNSIIEYIENMRLRLYLKTYDIRQEDFGKTIRRSASMVSKIVSGQHEPGAVVAARILRETSGQVTLLDLHAQRLEYLANNGELPNDIKVAA